MKKYYTGNCGRTEPHTYHEGPNRSGGINFCYGALPSASYNPTDEEVERAARRLSPWAWDNAAIRANARGMVTQTDPQGRANLEAKWARDKARKTARTVLESLQLEGGVTNE